MDNYYNDVIGYKNEGALVVLVGRYLRLLTIQLGVVASNDVVDAFFTVLWDVTLKFSCLT